MQDIYLLQLLKETTIEVVSDVTNMLSEDDKIGNEHRQLINTHGMQKLLKQHAELKLEQLGKYTQMVETAQTIGATLAPWMPTPIKLSGTLDKFFGRFITTWALGCITKTMYALKVMLSNAQTTVTDHQLAMIRHAIEQGHPSEAIKQTFKDSIESLRRTNRQSEANLKATRILNSMAGGVSGVLTESKTLQSVINCGSSMLFANLTRDFKPADEEKGEDNSLSHTL
ncbi:MAG: hypothetical protein V3V61_05585 [Gammaproteobacteria bacterium]